MSELTFCKHFLTALDARPIKLSSDHIADARQYPAQSAYTLPRLPHPPHPPRPSPKPSNTPSNTTDSSASTDPSPSTTLNITLKPLKPTPSTPAITLPAIPPSRTSIYDLKQSYATQTALSVSKIKVLWRKKPVADSKTVAEVVGQDAGDAVEFSVMIMGGVAAGGGATPVTSPPAVAPPSEAEKGLGGGGSSSAGPAAQGPSGKDVVATSEFWDDLKGFVVQRVRDEQEGDRLFGLFKAAYEKDR
ncbi:hypothetical protein K491DRAFT_460871 [Lophiostoma macrostomum CBS 122681]|uniref:Ubiquitin-like domain-containing protein n=1 Tax=Lophiostoma macrostomum CBS 122681 TaxID=1314788 RepID=A0A6A6T3V2_9PLEO|nr:hypothetical protein K491DRAFT_460871 [Lophiostoma macrostomum CBS 122681]